MGTHLFDEHPVTLFMFVVESGGVYLRTFPGQSLSRKVIIIIIIFIRHMTGQQGMTCTNSGPTKYHRAKTYKTIRHNTHETLKIHFPE